MIEIDTVALYVLFGAVAAFLFWILWLEYRLYKLFKGKTGADLEETIATLVREQKKLEKFREELRDYLTTVEKRLKRSVQGVETIRFNPFKGDGSGGNQSFSIAFLDEEGNGVVLSSLYARERVHTYAKPIKKFESAFELSDEEKEAIEKARQTLS